MVAATLSLKPAPAGEMDPANSAVAGASDTKRMGTAESLSECNAMNAGEMVMMNSCLMPFGIMTGEAGKWMVGYQFMHEKMDGSLVGTDDISVSQILKQFQCTYRHDNGHAHVDGHVCANREADAERDDSLRPKGNEHG